MTTLVSNNKCYHMRIKVPLERLFNGLACTWEQLQPHAKRKSILKYSSTYDYYEYDSIKVRVNMLTYYSRGNNIRNSEGNIEKCFISACYRNSMGTLKYPYSDMSHTLNGLTNHIRNKRWTTCPIFLVSKLTLLCNMRVCLVNAKITSAIVKLLVCV